METDTHTHTDTQNDYRNPRCACAPRVNDYIVKASHCELTYQVTLSDQQCPNHRCVPQCTEPECVYLCRHLIKYNCLDYQEGHLCKHCHKVKAMGFGESENLNPEKPAEPFIFNPPSNSTNHLGKLYTICYTCHEIMYI